MVDSAVVFGLVLAFCFGTSDYLSKGLTAEVGFYRTTVYTLATSGALVVIPLLFLGPPTPLSYPDTAILLLVSSSTFFAFLFMYRGYSRGNLSLVSPVVNSFPIFSVLFSLLFLGIHLSGEVLLALAGVIVGILLVSINLPSLGKSGRLTPGIPDALAAALLFAVALTSLGEAYARIGYLLPSLAARLGGALVGLGVGAASKQDLSPVAGKPALRLLAMGLLEATGLVAYSLAFFYSANPSVLPITTTLAGMGAVFTVSFALVFLKEKVRFNYAVGITVLILSVGALLYLTA
jgi:drug/metabolite transporter (DMT)-like permease